MALLRGLEHVRTALHQAHVHRPPLCHRLEKGVVQLAQVKVEEAVGREAAAAGAAQVSMGRLVVRLVLQRQLRCVTYKYVRKRQFSPVTNGGLDIIIFSGSANRCD